MVRFRPIADIEDSAQTHGGASKPSPLVGVLPMISLLLGTMSLQPPAVRPPPPVRPVMPDHRFLQDYEPHRQILAAEWWCSGYKRPSTARFELRYDSIPDASGRFTRVMDEIRLVKLSVHGKPASAVTVRKIRELMAPLSSIRNLSGRCLLKRGGNTAPILRFDGYRTGAIARQRMELELDSK